jgi:hypothetical protein
MMWGTMLIVAAAVTGCAAKSTHVSVVTWYGTYSLDEQVELQVSSLGLSQIQFELVHRPSDRMFLSDVGSDAKGWFFVWDHQKRLWAHWIDRGTFVYLPDADGRWRKHPVTRDSKFVRQVPPVVFDAMPAGVRRSLGIRRPAGYARGGA